MATEEPAFPEPGGSNSRVLQPIYEPLLASVLARSQDRVDDFYLLSNHTFPPYS